MSDLIDYNSFTQTDSCQVECNPVKFTGDKVGFYICRSKGGNDKSISMTLDEADVFISELQDRIESKRLELKERSPDEG